MDKKIPKNPNTPEAMDKHYAKIDKERFNDWMMPYLTPLIPKDKKANILEIGCGMGRTLEEVRKHTECLLIGWDISYVATTKAKRIYVNDLMMSFSNKDASGTIVKNKYNLIINSQTLEHVDDPLLIIDNMKKGCIEGGRIFITVPWPHSSLDNGVFKHYWRFHPKDFKFLLQGCKIIKADKNHMVCIWKK